MSCIAIRVAIVSATMNGSSMCQYKHTRLWLECIWFLNAVWLLLPSISVSVCGRHSQTRGLVRARLKASTAKVTYAQAY